MTPTLTLVRPGFIDRCWTSLSVIVIVRTRRVRAAADASFCICWISPHFNPKIVHVVCESRCSGFRRDTTEARSRCHWIVFSRHDVVHPEMSAKTAELRGSSVSNFPRRHLGWIFARPFVLMLSFHPVIFVFNEKLFGHISQGFATLSLDVLKALQSAIEHAGPLCQTFFSCCLTGTFSITVSFTLARCMRFSSLSKRVPTSCSRVTIFVQLHFQVALHDVAVFALSYCLLAFLLAKLRTARCRRCCSPFVFFMTRAASFGFTLSFSGPCFSRMIVSQLFPLCCDADACPGYSCDRGLVVIFSTLWLIQCGLKSVTMFWVVEIGASTKRDSLLFLKSATCPIHRYLFSLSILQHLVDRPVSLHQPLRIKPCR